ncbi:hypothetical protein A3F37_02630 [Candidatus Saccharibacteria bacterium RIFCSPHIGHO2_12_FULL_41_12]|nr:MAG: hypothetical protein A3F37_02630 [Candidatus Saccharibacteria bacterium RIFCSPHIGHO2_12_FULL_41_12]
MSDEKTRQKVLVFLKHNPHGVLSTVSADGKPWGSSVYFAIDEDFNFFFITRVKTHKYRNIAKNHYCSMTVSDNASQTTVQAAGKVTRVPSKDIVSIVMKKLTHTKPHDDNKWVPPIVKVHGGDYMVLRLTPEALQYANFKQTKSDINESHIKKII